MTSIIGNTSMKAEIIFDNKSLAMFTGFDN